VREVRFSNDNSVVIGNISLTVHSKQDSGPPNDGTQAHAGNIGPRERSRVFHECKYTHQGVVTGHRSHSALPRDRTSDSVNRVISMF